VYVCSRLPNLWNALSAPLLNFLKVGPTGRLTASINNYQHNAVYRPKRQNLSKWVPRFGTSHWLRCSILVFQAFMLL